MNSKADLEKQVFLAARDQGISAVLFRNAIGRKLDLNVADNECLSFVTLRGNASPKEIARYTGLTTGSTTSMLDRLEKVGYIRRMPNPNDRRGVLVEISPRWREVVDPMVVGIQAAHRQLLAKYSENELKTIADFLVHFTENVNDHTRSIEGNKKISR